MTDTQSEIRFKGDVTMKKFLKVISVFLVFTLMSGMVAFATSGDIDPAIIAQTKETAIQIESEA